jgi:DNA repair ATPase RecN
MASSNEKFLKIIEDAESVAETISKLQTEVSSYNSAGKNLEQVRGDLAKYLNTAHEASISMLNLTNTLATITEEFSAASVQIQKATEEGFQKTNNKIQASGEQYVSRVKEQMQLLFEQTSQSLHAKINNLKIMVIVTMCISLLSLIFSIFNR